MFVLLELFTCVIFHCCSAHYLSDPEQYKMVIFGVQCMHSNPYGKVSKEHEIFICNNSENLLVAQQYSDY